MVNECRPKLKQYIANDTECRRAFMLKDFICAAELNDFEKRKPHHSCCDVFQKKCSCRKCSTQTNYVERGTSSIFHSGAESDNADASSDSSRSLEHGTELPSDSSCDEATSNYYNFCQSPSRSSYLFVFWK